MLQGDLSKKLTKGIKLMDFKVRRQMSGQVSVYAGFQSSSTSYKITCKMTNKIYIRNRQQHSKM
jgi:hypothetical protein